MIRPKVNKLLTAIAILSVIAMGVTAYLTYLHYEPTAAEFCDFGDQWNCEIVNKSQWSVLNLGFVEIPVAILGFLTYLTFFVFSLVLIKKAINWRKLHPKLNELFVLKLLKYFCLLGLVFSLYLTYVEAFILQTFCLFCVTQQVIIILITILFFWIVGLINADKKTSKVCEFC